MKPHLANSGAQFSPRPYKASQSNSVDGRNNSIWGGGAQVKLCPRIWDWFPRNGVKKAIGGNIRNLITISTISLKAKEVVNFTMRLHEIMNEQNMIKTD